MRTLPLALLLACGLAASAQAPKPATPAALPTVGEAMDATYQWVSGQFIPAAEAMPEEKFEFAPTNGEFKGVKTFAQQIKHVAAVNFFIGSQILGEKPPVEVGDPEMGPANLKTKAEIVKFLKESFDYAHKAIRSITAQNGSRALKFPFGEGPSMTPIGEATLLAFHGMDHYGQMVEYLRMNGIIPPASRPRPAAH
ncbi:MAG TPA: DinB family protein [Holophagaceae bacterium]|nr:DinB family protein [Holophagaceae bacterium]